ncbi:hypothetical protein SNARM312S_07407 [Streptomyces narbonensis]
MLLDDVAADFPGLTIILAHPSVPWQDEAISMATHKANVHIDLSGWSPKYFPPQLVRAAGFFLRHKVLFGSDFPVVTPDRWLADFDELDIKPEVRPLILKENAVRLLGLESTGFASVDEGVSNFLTVTLRRGGPSAARMVGECRRHDVYLRDLSPMSPSYEGRTVRIAVRDRVENARIVAACRSALDALEAETPAPSAAVGGRGAL